MAPLLIAVFLFLVLAPCLVAVLSARFADNSLGDDLYPESWQLPVHRIASSTAISAMFPEISPAEDFEIRSFPKGISQRRLLVRDTASGVKLTIVQVRTAAAALVELGGMDAAYRLALVAAAMYSGQNTVVNAACEALALERNAYQWLAWNGGLSASSNQAARTEDEGPPRTTPVSPESWRDVSQAA